MRWHGKRKAWYFRQASRGSSYAAKSSLTDIANQYGLEIQDRNKEEKETKEIEMNFTNGTHKTHNGMVTIENPQTGGERTFELRTLASYEFAAGKRMVSIVNEWDEENLEQLHQTEGFGFVNGNGINVWNTKKGDDFEAYAKMITNPESFQARGIVYHFEETCRVCNRELKTDAEKESGIMAFCAEMEERERKIKAF